MSKHTPGPWEVYHNGYHDTWSVEGGGDIVADLWRLAEETHNRHPHFEDDCEANARLISAAPDLLQACEGAMRIIDLWSPPHPPSREHEREYWALAVMRDRFIAAIAKAKGEQ